ncbi:MAG: HD domain-containing protein [Desulfobacterales bacterium]
MLDCIKIIEKFYSPNTLLHEIIIDHSKRVAKKALSIADRLGHREADRDFIYESAMLHDIGIVQTHVPGLGCCGNYPYIAHGILGRSILEKLSLFHHALVCERHVGVGLTIKDIQDQKLPLPPRDMVPESIEEQIVCYADKFFSKSFFQTKEKTPTEILESLARYGKDKTDKFLSWMDEFGT